jgi:2-desacetyl-2-hydroxyethyl bacteriochlorophyllide A dehydrogenase
MTGTQASGLWFDSAREASIRTESVGEPQEGEIAVRALYSLVSAGTEMNVYRGESASALEVGLPTRKGEFPFPIQFGYQVVGRVEAVGPSAEYREGDLVFCQHPHQDYFVISTAFVYPVLPALSPRAAAFSNLCNVALNCHLDVPVRLGDVCVVSGLGVIGTFAAHLARRTAGVLVLVDPLGPRRDLAKSVNADAVVSPAEAVATVEELSEGRGADVFIEASGAPPALQTALESTGVEGTVAVISYYGSRSVTLTLSPEFHLRRQRIVSSMVGMVGSGLQPRWDKRRRMQTAMTLVAAMDVESMITQQMPFTAAADAYELIDSRPEDVLGVLLDYESEKSQ